MQITLAVPCDLPPSDPDVNLGEDIYADELCSQRPGHRGQQAQ